MEPLRVGVLIPTYNNSRTVRAVIEGVLEHVDDVVVVDDGSTDATRSELWLLQSQVTVVRHETNRGKGAALRTGFVALRESGCTHAITIDSDGQHLTSDIPEFLRAIEESPAALVTGTRDLRAAGAPWRSRFGLACSNLALWLATGRRLRDTQTGFRAYPLHQTERLQLKGCEYDLEMEVLTKAARAGWPFESVPIACTYEPEGGRVTHFQPVRDFFQIGWSMLRS